MTDFGAEYAARSIVYFTKNNLLETHTYIFQFADVADVACGAANSNKKYLYP